MLQQERLASFILHFCKDHREQIIAGRQLSEEHEIYQKHEKTNNKDFTFCT
jgi:hypothetical protein